MEVKFYILGAGGPEGPWHYVEGPLDEHPEWDTWTQSSYLFQFYKVEKVWELPF